MLDALKQLGCRIEGDGDRLARHRPRRPAADAAVDPLPRQRRHGDAPARRGAGARRRAPGARFELRGTPRMHERPIGDLVDALRSLGCAIDYLEQPRAFRRSSSIRRRRRSTSTAPIVVRGDVSSQFLTALLLALPLRAGAAGAVDRGRGRADLQALRRDHAAPARALRHRRRARRLAALPRVGAAAACVSPGRFVVEGDASSASYFIAAGAIAARDAPLRIEGVGSDSIQGDIAFVDAVRAMGATIDAEAHWLTVRRGRLPLAPITLDCNHIPDAAMTLAALALFADGPVAARPTSPAGASRRPTGSRRWRPSCASSARRRRGRRLPRDHAARALARRGDRHLRRPPHGDGDVAGGVQRRGRRGAAVPVRILDPRCVAKTWPDYFETLFAVASAEPGAIPVLTIDGPTASGKGTLASAVAAALGYVLLDSGAVYRAIAIAALQAGVDADDEAGARRRSRARWTCASTAGRTFLAGADVSDSLRLEEVGALASRISAWPRVRQAVLGVQTAFRRLPGLVADGRDMGTVVFPDADLKVFLTASAAERAERRHKQLISKGISANIDSLRADLEARDARDINRSVSPLKPAEGAFLLDNSALSIEASVDAVLEAWEERRPFDRPQV